MYSRPVLLFLCAFTAMQDFESYLKSTEEIGFVDQVHHSIVYAKGLPKARPSEVILFESGEIGQVLSLTSDYVEILLLSKKGARVGTRIVRTDEQLTIPVSRSLLGKTIDPLGFSGGRRIFKKGEDEMRPIDVVAAGINKRKNINKPIETGVTLVDLVIPLGKGQRELVVGDRKTGKTEFVMQAILSQALKGMVCVYTAIGKRKLDIKNIEKFFLENGIKKNIVVVETSSSDPAGLVFLAPYTAMTIAEYFRDKGEDVLIVLDDLTAHANYYREVTLLARRFPGRSSYPGDIFYIHSRLLERAGNFVFNTKDQSGNIIRREASITCLPIAELVLADLSGYIQTNLMAMTDGHILFDIDLYTQGRRPAVNPFLSVTRVGRQAQTPLFRDINQKITSFLVHLEKLRQFMHFGAELSEETRRTLALGDQIQAFFDQPSDKAIPLNISALNLAAIWGGVWRELDEDNLKKEMNSIINSYLKNRNYENLIDNLIEGSENFESLVKTVRQNEQLITQKAK